MNLFNKKMCRAASNIDYMIVLAGSEPQFKVAIDNKEQLEILAQTEHLRWIFFHLTNFFVSQQVRELWTANRMNQAIQSFWSNHHYLKTKLHKNTADNK